MNTVRYFTRWCNKLMVGGWGEGGLGVANGRARMVRREQTEWVEKKRYKHSKKVRQLPILDQKERRKFNTK